MSTRELERRLTAVLKVHAEDAMSSVEPTEELASFLDGIERGSERRRRQWLVGGGVAAALAAAVTAAVVAGRAEPPADRAPEPVTEPPGLAIALAEDFVEAFGSYDLARATAHLSEDAQVQIMGDSLRPGTRWMKATGFRVIPGPCDKYTAGETGTMVRCAFDYHGLRSDELGRGPFTGSAIYVTVQDGEVDAVLMVLEFLSNGFSHQMWEPFADWVAKARPAKAAVMYADWPEQSLESHDRRSVRLWAETTREYVRRVS
jgi:hypothetical protein